MTGHLSARQVDEWLIGERPAEVAAHLAQCPHCAAELQQTSEPLALFGSAVRNWSEQIPARPIRIGADRVGFHWRAAMACAALLTILAVPAYRYRAIVPPTAQPVAAVTDEVLLQQVANGISRSVPAPMEPLAQLMSNDLNR